MWLFHTSILQGSLDILKPRGKWCGRSCRSWATGFPRASGPSLLCPHTPCSLVFGPWNVPSSLSAWSPHSCSPRLLPMLRGHFLCILKVSGAISPFPPERSSLVHHLPLHIHLDKNNHHHLPACACFQHSTKNKLT